VMDYMPQHTLDYYIYQHQKDKIKKPLT
jgi:hypothetical protein